MRHPLPLCRVLLPLLGLATAVAAAPSPLDPTFDRDGLVETYLGRGSDYASAVLVEPSGKVVVAGSTPGNNLGDFLVARFTRSGQLDRRFGRNGIAKLSLIGNDGAQSIIRQPDGKLIVGGSTGTNTGQERRFALARLNSDGSLDSSFGEGGKVTTRVLEDGAAIWGLALQSDGSVIAAGTTVINGELRAAVARYSDTGELDLSFDEDGLVVLNQGQNSEEARAVAVDDQNRIVLAGFSLSSQGSRSAVIRLTATGQLDTGFGAGGVSVFDMGPDGGLPRALAVQGDGILVAGVGVTEINRSLTQDFALARLDSAGSLDPTFGTNGVTLTDFRGRNDDAYAITLDGEGRILLAGTISIGGGRPHADFGLARYTAAGVLDAGFHGIGKVTTNIGNSARLQPSIDEARGVAVAPDQKIVVAGVTDSQVNGRGVSRSHIALARYRSH